MEDKAKIALAQVSLTFPAGFHLVAARHPIYSIGRFKTIRQ